MTASITSYAFGAFIMVIIDIEADVRNIDYRLNRVEYHQDIDPLTPKPLASFPPNPYAQPKHPILRDERPRPQSKWDMGQ